MSALSFPLTMVTGGGKEGREGGLGRYLPLSLFFLKGPREGRREESWWRNTRTSSLVFQVAFSGKCRARLAPGLLAHV